MASTDVTTPISWHGASTPAYYADVTELINTKGLDLLNFDEKLGSANTLLKTTQPSALAVREKRHNKSDPIVGDWVESYVDEQLMLFIPFHSSISLHSIQITSLPPASNDEDENDDLIPMRPKTIQIYKNPQNNLSFGATEDIKENERFILNPQDWDRETGTATLNVKFVNFQNTTSVVLFIVNVEGNAEKVRVDRLRLFGKTGLRGMGRLGRVISPSLQPSVPGASLVSRGLNLYSRYQQSKVMKDLEKAIQAMERAVGSHQSGQKDRAYLLDQLGNMQYARYEKTKDIDHLEAVQLTVDLALSATAEDDPNQAERLRFFQKTLSSEQGDNIDVLEGSISKIASSFSGQIENTMEPANLIAGELGPKHWNSADRQSPESGLEAVFLTTLLRKLAKKATSDLKKTDEAVSSSEPVLGESCQILEVWNTCLDWVIYNFPRQFQRRILEADRYRGLAEVEITRQEQDTAAGTESPNAMFSGIRLLELYPSTVSNSVIRCRFLKILPEGGIHPQYMVLSYAWKDVFKKKNIELDGEQVAVTESLESALRGVRDSKRPRFFWVDALCVEQDVFDFKRIERAYAQSEGVAVWLGGATSASRGLFKFFEILAKAPAEERRSIVNELACDKLSTNFRQAVVEFLTRPWWDQASLLLDMMDRRQLVNLTFQCGSDLVDLEAMSQFMIFLLDIEANGSQSNPVASNRYQRMMAELDHMGNHFHRKGVGIEYAYEHPTEDEHSPRPILTGHIMCQVLGLLLKIGKEDQIPGQYGESSGVIEAYSASIARIFSERTDPLNWIMAIAKLGTNLGPFLSALSIRLSGRYVRTRRAKCFNEFEFPQVFVTIFGVEEKATEEQKTTMLQQLKKIRQGETLDQRLEMLRHRALRDDSTTAISTPIFPNRSLSDRLDIKCWLKLLHQVVCLRGQITSRTRKSSSATQVPDSRMDVDTSKECERKDNSMSEEFSSYEPLDPDSQHIRVLLLHPSEDNMANIRCDLIRVDLALLSQWSVKRYPYTALSYCWGDPKLPPRFIFMHGKKMPVGPNLFAALQQLRDPRLPSLFWVDALCINQKNGEEMSHQVGMMGLIYQRSGHVLMWLGEESTQTGLDMLPMMLYDYKRALRKYSLSKKFKEDFNQVQSHAYHIKYGIYTELLERPYWTRVWTVQEVLLAQDATLLCGRYLASWDSMMAKCGRYGVTKNLTNTGHIQDQKLLTGQLTKLYCKGAKPGDKLGMSFLDLILLGQERSASDPRDYIYAFLGLSSFASQKGQVEPDYSKANLDGRSTSKVAFKSCIEETSSLDALSCCRKYNTPEEFYHADYKTWPSWLPDWSAKSQDSDSDMILSSRGRTCYTAAEQRKVKLDDAALLEDSFLIVDGMIFDTVEYASGNNWPDSMEKDWSHFSTNFHERTPYYTARDKRTALAETAFLGQTTYRAKKLFCVYNEKTLVLDAQKRLGFDFCNETSDRSDDQVQRDDNDNDQGDAWAVEHDLGEEAAVMEFSGLTNEVLLEGSKESLEKTQRAKTCFEHKGRFFVTSRGYIGRGPIPIREGDLVCILYGAKVPFILRETADEGVTTDEGANTDKEAITDGGAPTHEDKTIYRLVGESYVHGIMNGNGLYDPASRDCKFKIA